MKLKDFKGEVDLSEASLEIVAEVQSQLNRLGYRLAVDGLAGVQTLSAFNRFKLEHYLGDPDRLGPTTAKALVEAKANKFLDQGAYQRAAVNLGVEAAVVRAVVSVETTGRGFLLDGRPQILFERHWFYKLSSSPVSKSRPDLSNPRPGGYLGGAREWERLNAACYFDRPAALKSASWGLGQIMGFNHAAAGYSDIESFVRAMEHSEGKQLDAMMTFIARNHQMLLALQRKDWATFARLYNGPAYRRNNYDNRLAAAYRSFSK